MGPAKGSHPLGPSDAIAEGPDRDGGEPRRERMVKEGKGGQEDGAAKEDTGARMRRGHRQW